MDAMDVRTAKRGSCEGRFAWEAESRDLTAEGVHSTAIDRGWRSSHVGNPSPAVAKRRRGGGRFANVFAKRVGVPDTRRIRERRSYLMTEPSDFGRLSPLERKARDEPLGLDHPHRGSRFRSNLDSPASLRSRESGELCANAISDFETRSHLKRTTCPPRLSSPVARRRKP